MGEGAFGFYGLGVLACLHASTHDWGSGFLSGKFSRLPKAFPAETTVWLLSCLSVLDSLFPFKGMKFPGSGFAFPVQQPMFPEWGRLGGFPRGQRPGSRRQGGVPAERRAGLAGRPSVGRLAAACGRSGGCGGGGGGGGGGAARGAGGSHVKRTRRADGAPPCPLRCALWPGRARCCRHSAPTWAP